MVASQHTQTAAEFRQSMDETFRRLNQTGDPEVITVNGEAQAVLISPSVYEALAEEIQLQRDVEIMRRGMKDIDEGRGVDAGEFFAELHEKLIQLKNQQEKGDAR